MVADKVVPTNFFEPENTEHISAVLFSNAGTSSEFNRMGVRTGFGGPCVQLIRIGGLNDPTPGTVDAQPFKVYVKERNYSES